MDTSASQNLEKSITVDYICRFLLFQILLVGIELNLQRDTIVNMTTPFLTIIYGQSNPNQAPHQSEFGDAPYGNVSPVSMEL
jgi:hypothetical protein